VDYQMMFNLAVSVAAFFGGWTLSRIYTAIDRLDQDIRSIPHDYVSKSDYKTDMHDIKDMLNKIFDKLDAKVDK
jgi:cell fate (sporulation/competence/biofilm development) regulator YmcA (YheA/YmcA/DUF963 family)